MFRTLKKLTLSLLLLWAGTGAFSQNESDVLRMSRTGLTGTARALGMGGAFSAVGADMTAGSMNPAGLGLYRSSSISFSPAVFSNNTTANYLDATSSQARTKLMLPGMGIVLYGESYKDDGQSYRPAETGFKSYTFSFGYNQKENYNREYSVTAYNPHSSISDMFADQAQGRFPNNLGSNNFASMAWEAFAIDTIRTLGGRTYFPAVNDGRIDQTINLQETGRLNEWFVAVAGNISDVVYIGGSVGIQGLRYSQNYNVTEEDVNNLHQIYDPFPPDVNGFPLEFPMNSLEFRNSFTTSGTGINGQIGVILRGGDVFRGGLSLQTPTYFSLTDRFSARLIHNYSIDANNTSTAEGTIPELEYDYNLVTPYRATVGGVFFLGKAGFVSVDADFTDYSAASLRTAEGFNDFFQEQNNRIQTLYKSAVNLRLGAEGRYGVLRYRAGFAWYGNPYTDAAAEYLDNDLTTISSVNASRKFFTLGGGIRQPNFFMDVSLVNQLQNDKFSPYSLSTDEIFVPTVVTNRTMTQVMLTMGFTFE